MHERAEQRREDAEYLKQQSRPRQMLPEDWADDFFAPQRPLGSAGAGGAEWADSEPERGAPALHHSTERRLPAAPPTAPTPTPPPPPPPPVPQPEALPRQAFQWHTPLERDSGTPTPVAPAPAVEPHGGLTAVVAPLRAVARSAPTRNPPQATPPLPQQKPVDGRVPEADGSAPPAAVSAARAALLAKIRDELREGAASPAMLLPTPENAQRPPRTRAASPVRQRSGATGGRTVRAAAPVRDVRASAPAAPAAAGTPAELLLSVWRDAGGGQRTMLALAAGLLLWFAATGAHAAPILPATRSCHKNALLRAAEKPPFRLGWRRRRCFASPGDAARRGVNAPQTDARLVCCVNRANLCQSSIAISAKAYQPAG